MEENSLVLGEYTYNALGQRVIKEAGGTTTIFHYDFDGQIIAESLTDGTVTSEYLYVGSCRLAKMDSSTGTLYHYLNNYLGTPLLMTDGQGVVVWDATYRPFGEAEVNPNSTMVNNFRLPGQYNDQETGLYYNYHRYYDPQTGRYLTPDPSHFIQARGTGVPYLLPILLITPQELHLYPYVQNNPIVNTDPEGLMIPALYGAYAGAMYLATVYGPHLYYRVAPHIHRLSVASWTYVVNLYYQYLPAITKLVSKPGTGQPPVSTTVMRKIWKFVSSISEPSAEDSATNIPTPQETPQVNDIGSTLLSDITYPPGWFFSIYVSNEEVTWNNYVDVWVDSGGSGCPPYSWSVSGTGFHFGSVEGLTTAITNINLETLQLWADDTACGSAIITVADSCGGNETTSVREPNNGGWYLVAEEQCSHWERDWCCFCYCVDTFEVGAHRYQNIWIGDKACQMTEESCGPYGGGEDLRGNACWVVGFYTPAYCGTFFQKNMWEWRCAP